MGRTGAAALLVGDGLLGLLSGWWDEVDQSERWQRGIFYFLCGAYSLVSFISLVQLVRIQLRIPHICSIQKVFHLMNFVVIGLRAVLFGLYRSVFLIRPKALEMILLDVPGLLFFSTYTLFVLFWAGIYYQAKRLPSDKVKPAYFIINGVIYLIQIVIWVFALVKPASVSMEIAKIFFAAVSFFAVLGFLIYGVRLFVLLRSSPFDSRSLRNKIYEVGSVTTICCTCFLIRCVMVAASAFDENADLDILDHPLLNLIYYAFVEVIPSILVLFIHRKMPSKQAAAASLRYHSISSELR